MLGGDCSILLGAMLALRRRGRCGLRVRRRPHRLRPAGDLAERRGRRHGPGARHGPGSRAAKSVDGLGPLVRDEDVVILGHRDVSDPERYWGRHIFGTAIRRHDLPRCGARPAARARPGPSRCWRATTWPGSGSTWTSTCWTAHSCRRWTHRSRTASAMRDSRSSSSHSWRPQPGGRDAVHDLRSRSRPRGSLRAGARRGHRGRPGARGSGVIASVGLSRRGRVRTGARQAVPPAWR